MELYDIHRLYLDSSGVSTDTRKIKKDSMFFALKGENFNGNKFVAEALEKGACYAIVDEEAGLLDERCIQVENVLDTLQQLSTLHRQQLDIPIIGLTGSNGKTTTKELIHAVLSKNFQTKATIGNLNNHIGVPLTLLSMNEETEIGIVEMGANHLGEIAFLCEIAQPDFGYITNFGKAHLEGFGSVAGVVQGKSELYDYLKSHEKTLFLNLDDPIQKKQQSYSHSFSFSTGPDADVRVTPVLKAAQAALQVQDQEITSQLTGHYNATNMAAAVTIGTYFKLSFKSIKEAIEGYVPTNNRSQVIQNGRMEIIMDAYNANPTSMAAAIENLDNMERRPKIAILGDMFEMGAFAEEEHQQLVDRLKNSSIDRVLLIGDNFYRTTVSGKVKKYRTYEDFKTGFHPGELEEALVLIKGSRGMALERVLDLLK